MKQGTKNCLSRRKFVAGAAGGTALVGLGLAGCGKPQESPKAPVSETDQNQETGEGSAYIAKPEEGDRVVWSACSVNCGSRCVLQFHMKGDEILYVESDNTGSPEFGEIQPRACPRGRSIRQWLDSPLRLDKPMKRVGPRGHGEFEEISWDEAIDIVASEFKRITDEYGPDAFFLTYGSGDQSPSRTVWSRLLSLNGGYLGYYGDYSSAEITTAMNYMFGTSHYGIGSTMTAAKDSDLIVFFGNTPADTRCGGAAVQYDLNVVRESTQPKTIHIDPRLNNTLMGHDDMWVPLLPGTDAALVAGIAHVLINEEKVDEEFLAKYCVGYNADSLPEGAPANASYKDYILGTGPDGVEKTPEWAASITGVSADKIVELAHLMADAKAPFIVQGWGPQRHHNGEQTARAICMLPLLLGKVGLPGTNTGVRELTVGSLLGSIPVPENGVKAKVSNFNWFEAIDRGKSMTKLNGGVRGVEKLNNDIKCLVNYAGNCITNQHGSINEMYELLSDESKCEFIVVSDTVMTDTAKFADIILPDLMPQERHCINKNGYSDTIWLIVAGQPIREPQAERRSSYDVCADIASKLGFGEEYTEGLSLEEWQEHIYNEALEAHPDMGLPATYDEMIEQGIFKAPMEPFIALEDYIKNPEENALGTPSGKIEIYSADLAEAAQTWDLREGDIIDPLPVYAPEIEGREAVESSEHKLQMLCFHHIGHTHSSYAHVDTLQFAIRNQAWVNPATAKEYGVADGDMLRIFNDRGAILMECKVTSRIVPGVVGLPQGQWHDADMAGDKLDKGGCINTLTSLQPSPLAKGNHNSCLLSIEKYSA